MSILGEDLSLEVSKMLTRRQFLKASAVAGGSLLLPARWVTRTAFGQPVADTVGPGTLVRFVDPLPIPPVWTAGQLAERGLTMASSMHQFHQQLGMTPTFGYGGASYLGPTIEGRRGEPISFVARNRLGPHVVGVDRELHGPDLYPDDDVAPRVSLHLHGGYTEPESDGYPEDVFIPGEDHVYNYEFDQQSGSTWYHDHALGITRLNVYAGLAGFFPIRDGGAEARLPPRPFEIPVVLQDKSFLAPGDGTNPMFYPDPWEPEFFGNVPVVNGKIWPNHDVRRGLYRLRLLDGSSSRFYNLRFDPPLPWFLIGTDTGFVDTPVPLQSLVLAPGERADVLVDFSELSAGDRVRLMNQQPLPEPAISPVDDEGPFISELMQFTALRQPGFPARIPTSLRSFPRPGPSGVVAERNLLLVEIADPETGDPVMALLNNRRWDTTDIEEPTVHTLEQWNLINLTEDTHPIHLHLVQFVLRNRQHIDAGSYLEHVFGVEELTPDDVGNGDRPFPGVEGVEDVVVGPPESAPANEDGWKDTIQAHPGQVTRILAPFGSGAFAGVPFGQTVTHTGEYVWHCHILDHEDHEMMLPYQVLPG
jgi:spore coat protein A, manganese oxidase